MSQIASMNTRPPWITDAQLGSQEWLMKRASLPLTPASITVLRSTMKRKHSESKKPTSPVCIQPSRKDSMVAALLFQ